MIKYIFYVACFAILIGCEQEKQWTLKTEIPLGKTSPTGLAIANDQLWISDSDNNKLVEFFLDGKMPKTHESFERPMHIGSDGNRIYVPEYLTDTIIILDKNTSSFLSIDDSLDAPASIDIKGSEIAIADFYNHSVLFYNGTNWFRFGEMGKGLGQFYHPTDVHISKDHLIVADAYNNRLQLLGKNGKAVKAIGEADGMNATTGVFANEQFIFTTDFEHGRLLIYDYAGDLLQMIEGLQKPSDVIMLKNKLVVANYGGNSLSLFEHK